MDEDTEDLKERLKGTAAFKFKVQLQSNTKTVPYIQATLGEGDGMIFEVFFYQLLGRQ